MTITTAQIRGARGILNWSQADLAERTGISATSIGSIENGNTTPRESTILVIRKAFEEAGLEFIEGGVRKKFDQIEVFTGKAGFMEFFDDVYNTSQNGDGEICINNSEDKRFLDLLDPSFVAKHINRMEAIKNLNMKILSLHGSKEQISSSYAEYRYAPKDLFSFVPFYVYGQKLAVLIMEDSPKVIVLDFPEVAQAYRVQFHYIWDKSEKIG